MAFNYHWIPLTPILKYALNTLFSEPIVTPLESCKKEKRTYSVTKRQKYKLKKKQIIKCTCALSYRFLNVFETRSYSSI